MMLRNALLVLSLRSALAHMAAWDESAFGFQNTALCVDAAARI